MLLLDDDLAVWHGENKLGRLAQEVSGLWYFSPEPVPMTSTQLAYVTAILDEHNELILENIAVEYRRRQCRSAMRIDR